MKLFRLGVVAQAPDQVWGDAALLAWEHRVHGTRHEPVEVASIPDKTADKAIETANKEAIMDNRAHDNDHEELSELEQLTRFLAQFDIKK